MKPESLSRLPFRLGTTSYIVPDRILPNVRFLSDKVDDIELVLFETDQEGNIPDESEISEMKKIASDTELSFTVHLPLDLKLNCPEDNNASSAAIQIIRSTVEATLALDPYAYVLHLDSHQIRRGVTQAEKDQWVEASRLALENVLSVFPDPGLLTVENLESYPAEWNHPVIDPLRVAECIDIGHLWLQEQNAAEYLQRRLSRTRVIHLHGIGLRDHESLRHQPIEPVREVLDVLNQKCYEHVVTLEVFSENDLFSSIAVIQEAIL